MASFELDISVHDMFCIQGECDQKVARIIRSIVLTQLVTNPAYRLRNAAGAFLQSYCDDSDRAYILVEFWSEDGDAIMAFIDYVNEKVAGFPA